MMNKIKVIIPNECIKSHLIKVKRQMKNLQCAPIIQIVWWAKKKAYLAIEGSHRLTAAAQLNIDPIFIDLSKKRQIYIEIYLPYQNQKVSKKEFLKVVDHGPVLKFKPLFVTNKKI